MRDEPQPRRPTLFPYTTLFRSHFCLSTGASGVGFRTRCDRHDRGAEEMKPAVSVVIVNLNRRDLLARCLDSLWRQTFSNHEVVVVDNGSSDGSVQFLQTLREPRLRIGSLPLNKRLV